MILYSLNFALHVDDTCINHSTDFFNHKLVNVYKYVHAFKLCGFDISKVPLLIVQKETKLPITI